MAAPPAGWDRRRRRVSVSAQQILAGFSRGQLENGGNIRHAPVLFHQVLLDVGSLGGGLQTVILLQGALEHHPQADAVFADPALQDQALSLAAGGDGVDMITDGLFYKLFLLDILCSGVSFPFVLVLSYGGNIRGTLMLFKLIINCRAEKRGPPEWEAPGAG